MAGLVDVAVVIPTHNRRVLAMQAIRSVLAQSSAPREVIVVDDASTDGSADAIREAFGSRVQVLRSAESIERGAARNWGAASATAELLAFLDSDDEWEEDKLARQLEHRADEPTGAWVTGLRYIDEEGADLGTRFIPDAEDAFALTLENRFLGSPSSLLLLRSHFVESGGFPEARDLQGSEDWLFLNLLHASGTPFGVVPEPLVRYRIHSSNTTGDPTQVARSMWAAVRWLVEQGLVADGEARRLRARTAGVIARGHAAHRQWRPSSTWGARAIASGAPIEGVRAALLTAGTAFRAATRNRA